MMEKEYYTLEEAERRFELGFEDIKYLVQKSKITPVFYLEAERYVIGTWENGLGFIGHAVASYKGLVYLSHDVQLTLINEGRVRALEFGVGNKLALYNVDIRYPFKTPAPNAFVCEWEPCEYDELVKRPICARLVPKEGASILDVVGGLVESLVEASQNLDKKRPRILENSSKQRDSLITEQPELEIKDRNHLFKQDDILILHQDLVHLGVIKKLPESITQGKIENKPDELSSPELPKKRSNQLTELLERLLMANPKVSAKEAWRTLEEEVSKDLDERTYDTDGILMDVSHSEIAWKSRYGNSSVTKLSTFDGALSRVRKRLNV